jgi:hypothetical protein
VATTDLPHPRFPAAASPPPVSPPRHPPSTASTRYKGRPPPTVEHPFFLLCFSPPTSPPFSPPLSRRGQPAPASLRPFRPHPEHRAAVYNLPAPRAVDHHPQTPPPPPFPSGRPHLAIELVLPMSSSFPPHQNGSTTLPPCSPDPPCYTSSPGAAGIWPGRHQLRCSRAPPLPHRDGPPAHVAGLLGRAGRALPSVEPKCTVHFLNYLSISFELNQTKFKSILNLIKPSEFCFQP